MNLTGRRILITGSLVRTGRQLAFAVAEQGAAVCVHGRRAVEDLPELLEGLRQAGAPEVHFVAGDVTDPEQVNRMAEDVRRDFGGVDSLVNNVGVYDPKPLAQIDAHHWRWTFAGNLDASFYCAQAFMGQLLQRPRSRIVNLGYASCDRLRPAAVGTAYQIAKTGVHLLGQSLARTHAGTGLTVNTLSPGQLENSIDLPSADRLPSGRACRVDELAQALLYLLSPQADQVTGTNLELSGAWQPRS